MNPISPIQPPPALRSPFDAAAKAKPNAIDSFGELLVNQVQEVNTMQLDANEMVHSYLTGGDVNEAEALTAIQKADLAFRMMIQVRNKLVEAYREVQQIQI
ncbi:MAG: flagellar hook-basal body complex protein FliE [Planctomycetota bacterium]